MKEAKWWRETGPCPTCGSTRLIVTDKPALREAMKKVYAEKQTREERLQQRIDALESQVKELTTAYFNIQGTANE